MAAGLTKKEAEEARHKYGTNSFTFRDPFGSCLVRGASSLSVRLLIISILLDVIWLLLGLLEMTAPFAGYMGIFVKIAAAAVLTFVGAAVRKSSEDTLNDHFLQLPDRKVTVIRGTEGTEEMSPSELTVGDMVLLSEGDIVPADGIVEEGNLSVEQSALGFSAVMDKTAAPSGTVGGASDPKDTYSVYGAASVVKGSGCIRITAVGDGTAFAKKNESNSAEIPEDPFSAAAAASYTAGAAAALAAGAFIAVRAAASVGLISGILDGLSAAAVILAVISLGKSGVMFRSLAASSVKRLKAKGISARQGECLVNVGKTDILMTEREGMITDGSYTVSGFIDGSGKEYHSFEETGTVLGKIVRTAVTSLVHAEANAYGTICGNAPLDKAILGFIDPDSRNGQAKIQADVSGDRIHGATVSAGNELVTVLRGSFGAIYERCGEYFGADGKRHRITNKSALKKLADTILLSGKDIEAFAFTNKKIKGGRLPAGEFVLIGMIALQDSYPEGSRKAVERLEKMGVRTVLVTSRSRGNTVFTAKYSGIKKSGGVVLDSAQLGKMSDTELSKRSKVINAAAETSGGDKLRLVRTESARGKRILFAGVTPEDLPAMESSAAAFASASAQPCMLMRCGASAEGCGIVCAAELIAASRRLSVKYRIFIYLKMAAALAMLAAVLFMGG